MASGAFNTAGAFPDRIELNLPPCQFEAATDIAKQVSVIAEAMTEDAMQSTLVSHGEQRLIVNLKRQLDRYTRSR